MQTTSLIDNPILSALPGDGIGSRAEWVRAGATDRMFVDGRLQQIARGLYAVADGRPITPARLASVLPDDAVVGGWAAALAYGVRDASPTMVRATPDDVLVYPGRHQHKKLPGFHVLRSHVGDDEIERVDGIRFTSLLRTAYDMARFAPSLMAAVGLLDCFLFEGNPRSIGAEPLAALIEDRARSRGNARIRAALPLASTRSRSIPESLVRARLTRDCEVPTTALMVNAQLDAESAAYELDLVDTSSGLVLEYDGQHHVEAGQQGRDSRKDSAIAEVGLTMFRVTRGLLGSSSDLAREIDDRRRGAIKRGGCGVVSRLIEAGRLAERRLPIF